jgi:hypothetical protein
VNPSGVLTDSVSGYRALLGYLAPLSVLANAALLLYSIVLIVLLGHWGLVGAVAVTVVGSVWLGGLLVQAIHDLQHGEGNGWIGSRIRRFWPRVNTLSFACAILYVVPFVGSVLLYRGPALLGALLLLVGFVLLIRWCVVVPLVMIDGESAVPALRRSHELVRGHGWQVFGALLVSGLLAGGVTFVLDHLLSAVFDPSLKLVVISRLVTGAIVSPFYALVITVIYYRLSELEVGDEQPAAIAV